MNATLDRQLLEVLGTAPDDQLKQLVHHREAMENVARELLTGVDPETAGVFHALLDLVEAERSLNLALLQRMRG